MLTPIFKKSKHVGIVEFLVTVAFGFVGLLIVFVESFPKSLVWLLSPFCQCTFLIGIAQVGDIFMLLSLNIFYFIQHVTLPWMLPLICKKKKNQHKKGMIFEYWSIFYIGFIYFLSIFNLYSLFIRSPLSASVYLSSLVHCNNSVCWKSLV